MAFKVTDVINESMQGTKPSLFMASIDFPALISGGEKAKERSRFLIKATSLPASTLGMIEMPFMGRKIKIAGDRSFEDWETTIINDEKMLMRSAIEKWSDGINGMQSNRSIFTDLNGTNGYRTSARVTQLATNGDGIRTYEFHNIWPSSIAALEVAWETVDTMSEFAVTWTYDFYTAKNGTAGTVEGILQSLAADIGVSIRELVESLAR